MKTTRTIFVLMLALLYLQGTCLASNEAVYEAELEFREQSLQSTLSSIQKQIKFLHENLAQLEGSPLKKVVVLEDALADERDVLLAMSANHTLPLKNVPCHNYSQETIEFYEQEIASLEEQTQAVGNDIEGIKSGLSEEEGSEMWRKYEWINQNLQNMVQIVQSLNRCSEAEEEENERSFPIDISKSSKISNLKATNWIYGTLTADSLKLQLFQELVSANVTTCSLETPYVVNGKCVDCQGVYDVSLKECSQCPEGMLMKPENHQCKSIFNFCYTGQFYNSTTRECECPSYAPYFTGLSCVDCYLPHFWDGQSRECQSCPEGSVFNLTQERCQACPTEKPHAVGLKCEQCSFTSYLSDSSCVACPDPQFYSRKEKRCMLCQEGSILNEQKNACKVCPPDAPVSSGNLCVSCGEGQAYLKKINKCIPCVEEQVFVEEEGVYKCICPEEKPFFNGEKCLSCLRPNYWNKTALECKSCPAGSVYSGAEKSCQACPQEAPLEVSGACIACPPNSLYSAKENQCNECPSGTELSDDLTSCKEIVCSIGGSFNHQSQACECPEEKPYDNTVECISCGENEEWEAVKLECHECGQTSVLNPERKKCEQCPEDKPFVKDGKCIGCPENSFYDADQGMCMMCATGSIYDKNMKKCVISGECNCPQGLIEIFNPKLGKCECVKLTEPCQGEEYWNESTQKCEKCLNGAIYSEVTFACECPEGQSYDASKGECTN